MMNPFSALIAVFERARALLALPGNDFSWSSWEGADACLAEIDALLDRLRSGAMPDELEMSVLFAPTGPIQEVSLSSGWGYPFLELADRFDAAIAASLPLSEPDGFACRCLAVPLAGSKTIVTLGLDANLAEVSLRRCLECGRYWLSYRYELEAFTGSGRWYLGPITAEQFRELTLENAKRTLEELDWYFQGGSYHGGESGRSSGAIMLGP